jgi:hypothetical protein
VAELQDDLLEDPWVRVGLAIALGFAAGRVRDAGVIRALVRTLVIAGVQSLARDAFSRPRGGASEKWPSPRDFEVH